MEEKPNYPSDAADKVLVRMPDGMRDKLKAHAKSNNRTMNAEIIDRLEAHLSANAPDQAAAAALPNLNAQLTLQHASLQLAEVACELLASELPKAKNGATFRALQNAIAAGLQAAAKDAPNSTDQSIAATTEALEKLRDVADRLKAQ